MKIFFAAFVAVFVCLSSMASPVASSGRQKVPHYPIDIPPDASGRAYANYFIKKGFRTEGKNDPVEESILIGTRSLQWLQVINKARAVGQKLELTTAALATGSPPEAPKIYNAQIIAQNLQQLKSGLPSEMAQVLLQGGALTPTIKISDAEFLLWARKTDKFYQTASRWTLMQPYLAHYAGYRKSDLRGYYFLARETDLESKLKGFSQLPAADQTRMKAHLELLCINKLGLNANCAALLKSSVQANQVPQFFNSYFKTAESLWKDYFVIGSSRSDFVWNSSQPNDLFIPFKTPGSLDIQNWLQSNIQDEWKWKGWQLHLNFQSSADIHVEFTPGVTPHVNGLGGNTITMDANTSLEDYEPGWTIRHEFGHVAGFPDCYIEFYDTRISSMVNYQLDLENLMCSRKGHLQQTHFDELKRVYYRAN